MTTFPQRVLLAVDGSQESDLARNRLVSMLPSADVEVHLVHVALVSPWTNPKTMNPGQRDRLRAQAQAILAEQTHKLDEEGITPTGSHVRLGRATDEVLRLRDELNADLIVLGSRGLNTFSRVLLGSDAESIVRHAPCAVLVVRQDS